MKFSILALGAAVAGISTQCAAQLQIESSSLSGAPVARLISQQEPVGSALADEQDMPYFAPSPPEDEPQAEITGNPLSDAAQAFEAATAQEPAAEQTSAPAGAPVGKSIGKPVTAGAPLHVLEMTPEVGMVPVCWQGSGCPTPNPVANYMVRSWCTNGLWDSYPCQRDQQCAHIQKQLFGHNRYTCGGCAACGNAVGYQSTKSNCNSCGPTASQCAKAAPVPATRSIKQAEPVAQSLMAATNNSSSLIGDLQAGLPVVDVNQIPVSQLPPAGFGLPPAQLTTAPASSRLPNGQPLLQLPADMPTAPENMEAPAMPTLPNVMPALPVPSGPVVASRPSVSLR